MKIHHMGIIVEDIKKNIEIYRALGYSMSTDVIMDDIQHLRICFMKSEDETQTIELIESNGEMSSIHNFQSGYHHICYDVSSDTNFVSHFKMLRIGKIFTQPIQTPAIDNRKVIFACLKNGMFVEFLIGENEL